MTSNDNRLWNRFPRWIEESGVPQYLIQSHSLASWIMLRKLIEIDCDQNLTPDWFTFSQEHITRWTGLSSENVDSCLQFLQDDEWLSCRNQSQLICEARIETPMRVPEEDNVINHRLSQGMGEGGWYVLRYKENVSSLSEIQKVIYLYQMLMGPKFSPRIVEDLEEIANTYKMELVAETFAEAFQRNIKTLSWIKSRLAKSVEVQQEQLS